MRGWLVLLIVACSSGKPVRPTPDPGQGSAVGRPIDDNDCTALVAHAIDLRVAEQRAVPDAGVASDADLKEVREQVTAALAAECHSLSHEAFRCALSATTTTALVACDR